MNDKTSQGTTDDPKKTIVEIRYKSIRGASYNHAFVVVTAPDGSQVFIRGGPSGGGGGADELISDSMEMNGNSYGNLVVNGGAYVPGSVDYTDHPTAVNQVLSTSESFSSVVSKLFKFGDAVNASKITYHPLSTNSNAFAHQAVTVLGVSRPEAKVSAPGSNTSLTVLRGGP